MYSHYFPPTTGGQVAAPVKHALSFQVHFQHVSGLANSELQIDTCLQPRYMSTKISEIYLSCPESAGPYELPELYSVADHACGCINLIEKSALCNEQESHGTLGKLCYHYWAPLNGSDGKESTCNIGDLGSVPGLRRYPGEGHGNPLQYSCLKNSMDGGAWQATDHGVRKSQTRLSN